MKRVRISTLMLLIMIAALCFGLVAHGRRAALREAERQMNVKSQAKRQALQLMDVQLDRAARQKPELKAMIGNARLQLKKMVEADAQRQKNKTGRAQ